MSKYKLVPVKPTREMWAAAGDAVVALNSQHHDAISEAVYKAMLTAAVQREPVGFCEDTALSLAERTLRSEVDEQLAEDIIQYARRLHELYTAPQPVPEVAKLVEALERLVFAAQCRDNSTGCQIRLIETRAELSAAANNAEEALSAYRQQEVTYD